MGDTKPRGNRGPQGRAGPGGPKTSPTSAGTPEGDRDRRQPGQHTGAGREGTPRLAARVAAGAGRPATDDTWDRRHSIRLSARLEDIIDALRGDTPLGAWIRDAAIERAARESGVTADDLDTAKRPAQRRANYSGRQERPGAAKGERAMSTGQAGSVVVQVDAADFGRLCENSGEWQRLAGAHGPVPGRGHERPLTSAVAADLLARGQFHGCHSSARAFLTARGFEYEVLFDTASDEGSSRMYGYVILTDYEEGKQR